MGGRLRSAPAKVRDQSFQDLIVREQVVDAECQFQNPNAIPAGTGADFQQFVADQFDMGDSRPQVERPHGFDHIRPPAR